MVETLQARGQRTLQGQTTGTEAGKVTEEVELSILALRNTFRFGTAHIQQGLLKLPAFISEAVHSVQDIRLSRESINNVLTRHGLNGYPRSYKRWRFFRAKEPDELWQIDFKGPFTVRGRRYWFLVCIDDYSSFLVLAKQFDHDPKTVEVTALLEWRRRLPKAILSDRGKQFREDCERWCGLHRIEAHYAHPSYPRTRARWRDASRT